MDKRDKVVRDGRERSANINASSLDSAASRAAEQAASRVEESLGDDGPPELDEFGRNVNMQREREARERR